MKKLLFSTLLGVAILSLTGCGEEKEQETTTTKCETGKCGEGKCGDN